MGRRVRNGCWCALMVLAGCAAPAPESAAGAAAPPSSSPQPAPPAAQPTTATPRSLDKLNPRTGGPLPPQVLPQPVRIDRSCRSDADCTVKNVGNCCGHYPACVNVASPTDPAGVQAQCAREGRSSSCGFQEITACACQQGRCVAQDAAGAVQ